MVPGVYRFETREITDKTYTMTINNYMINFSSSMGGLDYKSAKGCMIHPLVVINEYWERAKAYAVIKW